MKHDSWAKDLTVHGHKFVEQWHRLYPDMQPINYHFKSQLPKRWIRIYSLPEGQRYPASEADWDVLLQRQNTVIDYLVPQATPIKWVWNWLGRESHIFKPFDLIPLGTFQDLKEETEFESWMLEGHWETAVFNPFLTSIANDAMRAFIITPDCLIAPYDGGMDIIFQDALTAHSFKQHFADWVSPREDGG
jgi:hypothetical protein